MTDSDVIWFRSDEAPKQGHRLQNLYSWSYPEVPILNVKFSPRAGIAAVQKILPQEQFENSSIGFFNTETWSMLWRTKVPKPPGGTVTHPVEVLFLSEERYVLTDIEIAMYERERCLWKANIPLPPWPSEWPYRDPRDWAIVRSWPPVLDGQSLFIPVHWARIHDAAAWDGAAWQDRYAAEIVSISDGTWIRRFEEGWQNVTPTPLIVIEDARAVYKDGERVLGTLEPPKDRRITAADVSLESQRALVVLDGRELLHLALPSR